MQYRVLVVDDEPHIGQIIRTRLEQGPFDVMLAEDGSEAMSLLQAHPDTRLVVLDLMLPGMSGLDVLRAIRAEPVHQGLPCLVLTAAGQDHQLHDALALGAADVLTKPFSPRRLYERVVALVEHTQSHTDRDSASNAAAPDAGMGGGAAP